MRGFLAWYNGAARILRGSMAFDLQLFDACLSETERELIRIGRERLEWLVKAYRGELSHHACKRRIYLCFHIEDIAQVNGFRLMARAPNLEIDFYDGSLRETINSERSSYIKQQIGAIIQRTSVVVCLIGNGTAWRDWVNWELETAFSLGKGICRIRLKESRGQAPELLRRIGLPIARWGDVGNLIGAIEAATARRS